MPLKMRLEMSHELLKNEFVVYTARWTPRPVVSLVTASTPGSTHGLCAPPPGGPMWKLSGTSSSSQVDRNLDHCGWFKDGRPWTSGALNMVGPAMRPNSTTVRWSSFSASSISHQGTCDNGTRRPPLSSCSAAAASL